MSMDGSTEVELWRAVGGCEAAYNELDDKFSVVERRLERVESRRFVYVGFGVVFGFLLGAVLASNGRATESKLIEAPQEFMRGLPS